MATSSTNTPCRLLDLPKELRLTIFDRFIPGCVEFRDRDETYYEKPDLKDLHDHCNPSKNVVNALDQHGAKTVTSKFLNTKSDFDPDTIASLLATNKIISSEVTTLFWYQTTFVFWDHLPRHWAKDGMLSLPPYWHNLRYIAAAPESLCMLHQTLTREDRWDSFIAQVGHVKRFSLFQVDSDWVKMLGKHLRASINDTRAGMLIDDSLLLRYATALKNGSYHFLDISDPQSLFKRMVAQGEMDELIRAIYKKFNGGSMGDKTDE